MQDLMTAPDHAKGHLYLGELYLNTGRKENALTHLEKAKTMLQDMGLTFWLEKAQKLIARAEN
jgi:hypothetical protein